MKNIIIWPDIYRERGHWIPTISLADALEHEGHNVDYMGIIDCETIVSPYGHSFKRIFENIYIEGHSYFDEIEPIGQQWKSAHLMAIANDELDHVFAPTDGSPVPDLLISGYFSTLENLLIHYKYNIPFITITTYLRHPQEDPAMGAAAKLFHMPKAYARKLMDSVLPADKQGMDILEFVKPAEEHKEIIPCPKEFDCINEGVEHLQNVHYVEPMITRVEAGTEDPIAALNLPTDKKLIFATCGSHVDVFLDDAKRMFSSLIEMMTISGMENYHLLITSGPQLYLDFEKELLERNIPNITLRMWVSQLDVLKTANVVFLHGGLASIKESLWENVPIVAIPQVNDQFDNGLRIRKTGIGVLLNAKNITPQSLKAAMVKVTTNNWIKKNVDNMYRIFNSMETQIPKPSIQIVNEVLGI